MPKKAELMAEQKQAKARLAAAKQEARKAASALAEGERKLAVRRGTLDELEARMANSEEVGMLLSSHHCSMHYCLALLPCSPLCSACIMPDRKCGICLLRSRQQGCTKHTSHRQTCLTLNRLTQFRPAMPLQDSKVEHAARLKAARDALEGADTTAQLAANVRSAGCAPALRLHSASPDFGSHEHRPGKGVQCTYPQTACTQGSLLCSAASHSRGRPATP